MDFAGFTVINTGALTNVYAHRDDGTFFDNHPFNHFRACADEAVIFNNGRVSLQRLQHAADTHATGKVDVFTNLRTGTDGRPGINHGAFINICADVDVRRHQHGVTGNERALTHCRWWHDAEAFFLETCFIVVSEFHRHFVEVAAFCPFDHLIIINTEREQHRLFQPLMRHPLTVNFFRHTQCAGIQQGDHLIYRFAGNGVCIGWRDLGTAFKSGFNNVL